jgi:hypothetical protein
VVADGRTNEENGESVFALTVNSQPARTLCTGDRAHVVAPDLRSGVLR